MRAEVGEGRRERGGEEGTMKKPCLVSPGQGECVNVFPAFKSPRRGRNF